MILLESIRIMVHEHENIRRMLKVARNLSYRVLTEAEYDIDDFPKVIDFVRNYADKHHHGKEEDILFKTMSKELEKLAKSGAITGMYIEHDNSRLYMTNLENAVEALRKGNDEARLDVIANLISYTDLLDRHIEKENTAMYRFSENSLSEEAKKYVETEAEAVEDKATENGVQDQYIKLLEELEGKYY